MWLFMKKKETVGIIFTMLMGTLLHFVYEWSGKNILVGIIAPINESTWEHLKLLFVPFVGYAIWEYRNGGARNINFIPAKMAGLIVGLLGIPIMFYTYTGIVGNNFLWADILIFFISVVLAYKVSTFLLKQDSFPAWVRKLSLGVFSALIVLFVIFTFSAL